MRGVSWRERFQGFVSLNQTDFNQALLEGRSKGTTMDAEVSVLVDDLDQFMNSDERRAKIEGDVVECPALGGALEVRGGDFQMFVPSSHEFDHLHVRMRYRMNLRDSNGQKLRFGGFKLIENDSGYDSWSDLTTLFVRIYPGHWPLNTESLSPDDEAYDEEAALLEHPPLATAVIELSVGGFLRQVSSFRGTGGRFGAQLADVLRFGREFGAGVAKAYVGATIADGRPSFPRDRPPPPWRRSKPSGWNAVPGRDADETALNRYSLEREIVPFDVPDLDYPLNLHHLRVANAGEPSGRPVLLVPGSGVRAEMFYAQPVGETIVDSLLRENYDVWIESWRASIDLPNSSYTLDQGARIDHPRAVETVLEQTAETRPPDASVRAVVHCQGSISFMMAAVAGFLPEDSVSHIVSSQISLFFEVRFSTWLKQRATLPIVNRLGAGADGQWGIRSQTPIGAVLSRVASRFECPCGNRPCQIANFVYGAGWDTLLCHDNVDERVHSWSSRELGYTPFSLIDQVSESCRHGHIVPSGGDLPATFYVGATTKAQDANFTLIVGEKNRMFEPKGQEQAYEFLCDRGARADLVRMPGYGHLDTFWGQDAADEVFPTILAGLEWDGDGATAPSRTVPPRPKL